MQQSPMMRNFIKIFCLIFSVVSIAIAVVTIRVARQILAREHQIDVQGVPATGRVIGNGSAANKISGNKIEFAFDDAQGRRITHTSPVSSSDYQQLHVGDPVQVRYVPGHDDLCRLQNSTSKDEANSSFSNCGVLLFTGVVFFPLMGYLASKNTPSSPNPAK